MSKCRFCKGPVETSLRTGAPKLYCSEKCSGRWYHQNNYIKKNPDWGTRGERDRLLKEKKIKEREKKNTWIDQYCISKADLAKELGVHEGTLRNKMRALGLKAHKKIVSNGKTCETFTFIEKKDAEQIRNYKGKSYKAKTPLGYMSKAEAGEFFGISESGITGKLQKLKEKTGIYPVRREYAAEVKNGRTGMRCFYNVEDIKKVKELSLKPKYNCKKCNVEFETWRKRDFCSAYCMSRFSQLEKLAKIKQQGLISFVEAAKRIGCSESWGTLRRNIVKIDKGRFIKESKIQSLIWEYKEYLEKEAKDYVIRRKDNWQAWKVREERLISSFPAKLKHIEEKWGRDSNEAKVLLTAIDIAYSHHGIMEVTGKVTEFACKECNIFQPFYNFQFNARGSRHGRKLSNCRMCIAKKGKEAHDSERQKRKRQQNYSLRTRTQVGGSVKRHIGKVTGKYCDLSIPVIWRAIEKSCGYGHMDLVGHIESQFTPNMHWQNQKTPRVPGAFGWHLDHIVPHIDFKYDSLDHPDFAACWALENLRPLEAIMNMQKGNKKLYQTFQTSFRKGMKKAAKGEVYAKGIWKHLDYDNLTAKKILEKKFGAFAGMTWENWGKFWQLDHTDPTAHLAYTSPKCENFKKCWDLSNLRPVPQSLNSSKGSRFEDKLWFHNY